MKRLFGSGVKFLTVGAISTLIEVGVFNLLVYVLDTNPILAKVIASLVALVNAYFGNRMWAFRHRAGDSRNRELVLFLIVNAVCTALGAGIVAAGVALLGHSDPLVLNAVNIFSVGVIVVLRFALYHFFVFPGRSIENAAVAPAAAGASTAAQVNEGVASGV